MKGWRSFIDRVGVGELVQPVQREEHLHLHRLLAPERAVVVEGGDAVGGRHEVGAALLRHAGDEVEQRRLDGAVTPRRQGRVRATQDPPPPSLILATASSIVKLPGFWIGGKSLNVAANIAAPVCAA